MLGDNIFHGDRPRATACATHVDSRRRADLRVPGGESRAPTASSSSTSDFAARLDRGEARAAEEQLRRARSVLLRQLDVVEVARAHHAERARRARDLDRQRRTTSTRGDAAGAGARPRHRLARHRHVRVDGAGQRVRAGHRGAPGPQDRLHRGDRLAQRLDRRRDARGARRAAAQERATASTC